MSSGSEEALVERSAFADAGALAALGGPSTSKHAAGDILCGRYRLVSILRAGGMGTVWIARHLDLDIDVAIKVLLPRLSAPEFAERLQREARAAAQINHANIVRVIDVGQTALGEPFMAMELLHGSSLADVIDTRGRIAASMAVRLVLPLVDALVAAHAKGIVHRDLKPDNVVMTVTDAGVVVPKLVDFGIAKVADDDDGGRRLTEAGAVLGSPDYMAPEQARGERHVDGRTDVWAMCVLLYEMLTGIRPFHGPNYNALLHSILSEEPAPTVDFGAGDAALWQILAHGLQKRAADRLPDMQTLGQELASWAIAEGITEDVMGTSLDAIWMRTSRSSMPFPIGERTGAVSSRPQRLSTLIAPATDSDGSQLATSVPPEPLVSARRRSRLPFVLVGVAALGLVAALWWRIAPTAAVHQEAPAVSTTLAPPEPAPPPPTIVVTAATATATAATATAATATPVPKLTGSARKPPTPTRDVRPTISGSATARTGALPVPSVPNF